MTVIAPRSRPSVSQAQSLSSEPVSSRRAEVTQQPENTVAQAWNQDSFEHECPCKKKAQMLGLS